MNYNANQYEPHQTYQSESTYFFAPMTPQKNTKKENDKNNQTTNYKKPQKPQKFEEKKSRHFCHGVETHFLVLARTLIYC